MTLEKVNPNQDRLTIAFCTKERPYIQAIATRANDLLNKILANSNTKDEKLEYHALKWALKQLGGVEKEDFQRTKRPPKPKKVKAPPTSTINEE